MQNLELELKKLIIEELKLEDIQPEQINSEEPLFGSGPGLGLDSIDMLELTLALSKKYGVRVSLAAESFSSVATLARGISRQKEK